MADEKTTTEPTKPKAWSGKGEPPLRTDGPTLAEYVAAGYDPKTYPPAGYAPRVATPPAATVKEDPPTLEQRVTELENVVHALTNNDPNHSSVYAWVEKIGARIKAAVEKVV